MVFGTQLALFEPRHDSHGSLTSVVSRSANRSIGSVFFTKDPTPTDLAGYFVYATRKSLLAATTSLTRLSFNVHDFFMRINQMLAFERFVRSSWNWFSAATAPWAYGINLFWAGDATQKRAVMSSLAIRRSRFTNLAAAARIIRQNILSATDLATSFAYFGCIHFYGSLHVWLNADAASSTIRKSIAFS